MSNRPSKKGNTVLQRYSVGEHSYVTDSQNGESVKADDAEREIERLTRRVAELESSPGEVHFRGVLKDNANIAADNDRLRAALKDAHESLECTVAGYAHYCPNCDNSLQPLRDRITKALGERPAVTSDAVRCPFCGGDHIGTDCKAENGTEEHG